MNKERIIDTYTSGFSGSLLIITVAVHGNEPSGINALKNVFKILNQRSPKIEGKIIGIIGNSEALKKKVRFIDEDLNRTWIKNKIEKNKNLTSEELEMHDIIDKIKGIQNNKFSQTYFIDCHTTSSASLPYISVQQLGENNRWAQQFPIHIIRGFSDIVTGTIDGYLSNQGYTGFTVEAGQHNDLNSEQYHEGCIWIALQEACGLDFNQLPDIPQAVLKTMNDTPAQKTFNIIHRFGLQENDDFKMEPGFKNFQSIERGEHIAMLNGKKINSVWDAFIFMPLYQPQGNDGFFIVEEIKS
ncbi:hypothetical protein ULMS_27550 [Patiriisocius marinistellae]|uniref:Succinylglutamate desuccinylase/Aspartoacylase catalytic domain-containing protein n=1 Tax=Patiriisocius marinistellae TaxID=2494560 RepID=A0A5J4FWY2_9FLAO|nr:succinylglutamate desuccinylase/aspartoacylase family protein [Patiriisocius marinistellae]GEQ87247.1 hypothetical protein ULMS_27550 [Patiriisocius marinistellae]